MKRSVRFVGIILLLGVFGAVAIGCFLTMEPRLVIETHGVDYSEVVMHSDEDPGRALVFDGGQARLPLFYGKQLFELKRAQGPSLWLFYAHTDAGLRRVVKFSISRQGDGSGTLILTYNGLRENSSAFKFAEHTTWEHPLSVHGSN